MTDHEDRNEFVNPAGRLRWADFGGTRDLFGLSHRAADLALEADLDQLIEDLSDPAVWIEPPPDLVDRITWSISAAAARQRRESRAPADNPDIVRGLRTGGTASRDLVERAGTLVGSGTRFEVRVLGPLEVVLDGEAVNIGGAKARALVARLMIDRGLVVSVDRLVDSLWGDRDDDRPEIALRSAISRLRRRLREVNVTELIVTRAPGYVLDLPASNTDVHRFEHLVSEARRLLERRRPAEATRLLTEAQGIWRGAAYSDVRDEPLARAEVRRLEELLLTAIETRIDAGLTMGLHDVLVGELESLTNAHPLRERLWTQRMLALYRSGRQGEALRVGDELRSILADEVGIDPGPDLSWLERAIVKQDPALDFPVPPEQAEFDEPVQVTVPSHEARVQSSANEGWLADRDREYAQLRDWWDAPFRGESRLLLVDGETGVGKTRLVAELARSIESEGGIVLWARCDEDPIAPFQHFAEPLGRYFQSVSADVIRRLPEWQIAELARIVVPLRDYLPIMEDEPGDPETERFRFFGAITQTLNDLSARGPVLLVVDDMHWADQPTLLLLQHILRSANTPNLGIIAMYIDSEVPRLLRPALGYLLDYPSAVTVHLPGLSEESLQKGLKLEAARSILEAPEALSHLSEREQDIVLLRFGLYDGRIRTLGEVGIEFGMTLERVRQIETKTLAALRRDDAVFLLRLRDDLEES